MEMLLAQSTQLLTQNLTPKKWHQYDTAHTGPNSAGSQELPRTPVSRGTCPSNDLCGADLECKYCSQEHEHRWSQPPSGMLLTAQPALAVSSALPGSSKFSLRLNPGSHVQPHHWLSPVNSGRQQRAGPKERDRPQIPPRQTQRAIITFPSLYQLLTDCPTQAHLPLVEEGTHTAQPDRAGDSLSLLLSPCKLITSGGCDRLRL